MLEGGGGVEVVTLASVLDVQPGVEHLAAVIVVEVGGRRCGLHRFHVELTVGERVLAHPLVVGDEVEVQARCGLEDQTQLAACLVVVVGTVARGGVAEESVLS